MADVNIEFAKQKHIVILSQRAYGDLDYKQRKIGIHESNYSVKEQIYYLIEPIKVYII